MQSPTEGPQEATVNPGSWHEPSLTTFSDNVGFFFLFIVCKYNCSKQNELHFIQYSYFSSIYVLLIQHNQSKGDEKDVEE